MTSPKLTMRALDAAAPDGASLLQLVEEVDRLKKLLAEFQQVEDVARLKKLLAEARFELLDAAAFIELKADSVITWTDTWPGKGPFHDRRVGVREAMGRFKGRAAALRTTADELKAKEDGHG